MWFAVKRLSLGMLLIAAGSGVLLLTDVRPTGPDGRSRPRIAILQQASNAMLDDGVRGMIDGLVEKGYRDGETADIRTYNAEGDLPTANAIAREITDGRFDLVLTSSMPSLQVVANANKAGRAMHVFGIAADLTLPLGILGNFFQRVRLRRDTIGSRRSNDPLSGRRIPLVRNTGSGQ
jgi:hypothetical protein